MRKKTRQWGEHKDKWCVFTAPEYWKKNGLWWKSITTIYMYHVRADARPRKYSIVQPYRYIKSHVGRYYMVDSYLNSDRLETISKRTSIFLSPKRYYQHYYIGCIIQCDYNARVNIKHFCSTTIDLFHTEGWILFKCIIYFWKLIKLFNSLNKNIK